MTNSSDSAEQVFEKAHYLSKGPTTDLIILREGVSLENDPVYLKNFIESARKISGANKFLYDESTLELVDHTAKLDLEEILGNLDKVSFPFDRLWVEGPTANPKIRHGYLVETDSENHSFRFHRFLIASSGEIFDAGTKTRNSNPTNIVVANKVIVTVDKDGIHFDEDGLLQQFEKIQAALSVSSRNRDVINREVAKTIVDTIPEEINALYQNADFLARLFILMGADKKPKPATDLRLLKQEEEKNRRLTVLKAPMKVLAKPQLLNLSLGNFVKSEPNIKTLRLLFGMTNVSRSKPIVSKYGIVFTRKPHTRRIAAPEDRRGHNREITAGNTDMRLSFGPRRPLLAPNSPEIKDTI